MELLQSFLSAVEEDPRINKAHISLYVALWKKWKDSGRENSLSFFRYQLVGLCKISGRNTYYKTLRELHEYGYIKYEPSYDQYEGSLVYFILVE